MNAIRPMVYIFGHRVVHTYLCFCVRLVFCAVVVVVVVVVVVCVFVCSSCVLVLCVFSSSCSWLCLFLFFAVQCEADSFCQILSH